MLAALESETRPLREALASHRLYGNVRTMDDLRTFASVHVFAVWDFMSLLKALQRELTSVHIPWLPTAMPGSRRFVNELVLGEESDLGQDGQPISHFELYRQAMAEFGANTLGIDTVISALRRGATVTEAIAKVEVPRPARRYVEYTFRTIKQGRLPELAATFVYGREHAFPEQFVRTVQELDAYHHQRLRTFVYYLERHNALYAEEHGQLARRMLQEICGNDQNRWREASNAARESLQVRLNFADELLGLVKDPATVS